MSGIFDEDELSAANDTANPPVEEQQQEPQPDPAQESGQPRDEQGRFAPKEGGDPEAPAPSDEEPINRGAYTRVKGERDNWKEKALAFQRDIDAINELRRKFSEQPPAQQPRHDPETDPTGVNYLHQRLQQTEAQLGQFQQSQMETQAETQQRQVLERALVTSEQEFRAQAPDYDAAIQHLTNMRAQELMLHGLAPSEINAVISEEALGLVASAVQRGMNPAELAYQTARFRGYSGSAPQQGQQQSGQQAQSPAAQMVAALEKAQKGSRSLGSAGGATPAGDVNAATLNGMTEEEFAHIYSSSDGKRLFEQMFS